MTEKEARKELKSYSISKKSEKHKLDEIEEILTLLTKTTTTLNFLPSSHRNDKMERNIARLLDTISEHIKIMQEAADNLIIITKKINKLDEPYQTILTLKYIRELKMSEVAGEINKEFRYTKKLHKKAIQLYAKIEI